MNAPSMALAPGFIEVDGQRAFLGLGPCLVCGRPCASMESGRYPIVFSQHMIDFARGIKGGTCIIDGDEEYYQTFRNLRGIRRALRRRKLKDFPLPQDLRRDFKLYQKLMLKF